MRSVRELARIKNITTAACVAALLLPAAAAAAPKAPVPSAPADDAKVEAIGSFSWKAVKRADRYQFQLAADSKFGSIVLGKGHGSFETRNRYATIDESLGDGSYFWRVRAINRKDQAGEVVARPVAAQVRRHRPEAGRSRGRVGRAVAELSAGAAVDAGSARGPLPGCDRHGSLAGFAPHRHPVQAGRDFGDGLRPARGARTRALLLGGHPARRPGHPGARSAVGSFKWTWNSATTPRIHDLRDDARVFDPQFAWDLVLGAARYEIEVNRSGDWASGSRVCCTDPTTGTSLSPLRLLANNRLLLARTRLRPGRQRRPLECRGPFDKDFDHVVALPTIPACTCATTSPTRPSISSRARVRRRQRSRS